ncbi:MAG: tetratricopeptide repeat protein [bacterium]|nr:tetratricopeptide repeat protein [bacterium]
MFGCQSSALTAGKLYMKQQKFVAAREQLDAAVELEPRNSEAYYHLGRVCGVQGDYVELAEAFDRAQELTSEYDRQIAAERLHYWLRIYNDGLRAAAGRGADLVTARRHFSTAVRVQSDSLNAWRNLAVIDFKLGNASEALRSYAHVLEMAPEDTATAHAIGVIHLAEQRYDDAATSFAYVLQQGEHEGALINLAVAQRHQGQDDMAAATLARALLRDPACFTCHYILGTIHWDREDHQQALQSFQRAVELRPDDPGARFNLAIVYVALDDPDSALPLLQGLSIDSPSNEAVWRHLGRIYELQERMDDSAHAYERAAALVE